MKLAAMPSEGQLEISMIPLKIVLDLLLYVAFWLLEEDCLFLYDMTSRFSQTFVVYDALRRT